MSITLAYSGELLAGVDEVGRGPLAGDVVTAAVILDPSNPVNGLRDSKKLSEKKREYLFDRIKESALCYAIGRSSVEEVDRDNILVATMTAMRRAVEQLTLQPEYVAVDGNRLPDWRYASEAVIKGDALLDCISAASIMAKVTRDREMADMEYRYPGYGFAQHKGYGTAAHRQAIEKLGPCAIHRKSFEPIKSFFLKTI